MFITNGNIFASNSSYISGVTLSSGIITASTSNTINGVGINAGAITASTTTNTINGIIISAGSISGVTSINTGTNNNSSTISKVTLNNGAITGVTSLGLTGAISGATSINTGTSSDSSTISKVIFNNGDITTSGILNANGGISITGTQTFNNVSSQKIVFWSNSEVEKYGIGIQPSVLQIHCSKSSERVGIGYGSSSAFTETLTVKGGNVGIGNISPQALLHIGPVATSGFNGTTSTVLISETSRTSGPMKGPITSGGELTRDSSTNATLVLTYNNSTTSSNTTSGGTCSILFTSPTAFTDFGYIQYFANVPYVNQTSSESALLVIGIDDDQSIGGAGADRISLYPSLGKGFVGVNTLYPQYALDVTGVIRSTDNIYCRFNSTNGYSVLNPGNSSSPGYISFHKPGTATSTYNDTRIGYVGWQAATTNYISLRVEGTYVGYECNGIIKSVSFNATSDYRLKNNVQSLESNKTIDLLNPIEYDLSGGKHDMGFLAHEVQEIFPFLVTGEKDGKEMQSINYNGFIALLVKEVQDLKKENKILREKNKEMNEKNNSFESRLQAIEQLLNK